MISTLLGQVFLREVPDKLVAGVLAGRHQVYGSVIREVATGRIAGFLQEAAPLAGFASNPALGTVARLGQLGMSAGRLVQGEVIRIELKRVEEGIGNIQAGIETLNQLGIANLALSAAGVGISIAGFSIMSRKIEGVKQAVDEVASQIEIVSRKVDEVKQDLVHGEFDELSALAKSFDEGWCLSDEAGEQRWRDVAQHALRLEAKFDGRSTRLLATDPAHLGIADPMLDAVVIASGLRVAALAACNEADAAKNAAAEGARTIERLTGGIGLSDLARQELANASVEPGSDAWTVGLSAASEKMRPLARKIRNREASAATRAAPLTALEARGIRARDWLEATREEKDTPVLLMLAGDVPL